MTGTDVAAAGTPQQIPTDQAGIPLPMTRFASQHQMQAHRSKIGMLCEMLSRKHDRFGWERMDKGYRAMILQDFMDALQEYPIDELRAAARACEADMPGKMPSEHHIKAKVISFRERQREAARFTARIEPEHRGDPISGERAAEIMEKVGFTSDRMSRAKFTRTPQNMGDLDAGTDDGLALEEYMTPEEIAAAR